MTEGTVTVVNASYVEINGSDYMRFDTERTPSILVSNGFNASHSRALRVLVYLGGKPTDTEAVEGKELPVEKIDANLHPTDEVLEEGHTALVESEWYWKDIEAIKEANSPDPEDVAEEVSDGGS